MSFARKVTRNISAPIAIIKCAAGGTHLGGNWNPDESKGFKMYPLALERIRAALADLDCRNIAYRIEGFMWHLGENDMSFPPYRESAAGRLGSIVAGSRRDLALPGLRWFVSQQPPTDDERVNRIDVTSAIEKVAAADENLIHIRVFDLPEQEEKMVITTQEIVALGEVIAAYFREHR